MRAALLIEATVRPAEVSYLLEQSAHDGRFEHSLRQFKRCRNSASAGFPLDADDANRRSEMTAPYSARTATHLTHRDVNSGAPMVPRGEETNKGTRPGGVQITHEVDTFGTTRLWLYFDILLSDNSINPDGSAHAFTRAQDYALLLQFLEKREGLILDTPIGSFLNLGAIGWTADERHLPNSSVIKCQINNIGIYWRPWILHLNLTFGTARSLATSTGGSTLIQVIASTHFGRSKPRIILKEPYDLSSLIRSNFCQPTAAEHYNNCA